MYYAYKHTHTWCIHTCTLTHGSSLSCNVIPKLQVAFHELPSLSFSTTHSTLSVPLAMSNDTVVGLASFLATVLLVFVLVVSPRSAAMICDQYAFGVSPVYIVQILPSGCPCVLYVYICMHSCMHVCTILYVWTPIPRMYLACMHARVHACIYVCMHA